MEERIDLEYVERQDKAFNEKMSLLNTAGDNEDDPWEKGYPCYDTALKILTTIQSFGNYGEMVSYMDYPSHFSYNFRMSEGVSVSKITRLIPDLSMVCGVPVTVSNGDGVLIITVPKKERKPIYLRDFRCADFPHAKTNFALGDHTVCDLAKLPHLLIAGSSGSGKSVTINSIITTILIRTYDPREVRFFMIDPKQVELSVYDGIPNLILPVAKSTEDAIVCLENAVRIMEDRYTFLSDHNARDIDEYNSRGIDYIAPIIVVVDELADLMIQAKKHIEPRLVRLAQKGRAAGIHLIVATQEPTVNVITGLIKANMPCRIALKTSTSKESVVILGHKGAEQLFGHGDMIYKPADGSNEQRLQGVYVSTEEVQRICDYVRKQGIPNTETPKAKRNTGSDNRPKFRFKNPIKWISEKRLENLYKLG